MTPKNARENNKYKMSFVRRYQERGTLPRKAFVYRRRIRLFAVMSKQRTRWTFVINVVRYATICVVRCVCVVRSKVLQSKEISFRPHRITYWQVDHRLTTAHKMYRNSAFMAYIQMLYCTPKPKIATARTHTHTHTRHSHSQSGWYACYV